MALIANRCSTRWHSAVAPLAILVMLACGGLAADPSTMGSSSRSPAGGSTVLATIGGNTTRGGTNQRGGADGQSATSDVGFTLDPPCEGWSFDFPHENADAYWVVDASSSMATLVPATNSTRWSYVRAMLADTIVALRSTRTCAERRMALLLYPGMQTDSLVTEEPRPIATCINTNDAKLAPTGITDATDKNSSFIDQIERIEPKGATPTLDAYSYVVRRILGEANGRTSVIVLLTDGIPSINEGCRNPAASSAELAVDESTVAIEPILREIELARASGIRTVVIGAPGSEAQRGWLSRAAIAGGTATAQCALFGGEPYCHLDMTTAANTAQQVEDLVFFADAYQSCKFELPSQAPNVTNSRNPDFMSVFVHWGHGPSEVLARATVTAEDCDLGFRLIGATSVELCAGTCAKIRQDCSARLEVAFGCHMPATL